MAVLGSAATKVCFNALVQTPSVVDGQHICMSCLCNSICATVVIIHACTYCLSRVMQRCHMSKHQGASLA